MHSAKVVIVGIGMVLLASGCTTRRSISNSSYAEPPSYRHAESPEPELFAYRGELSEFDVLGLSRGMSVSDTEIERALDAAKSVRLSKGDSILLIQSGAIFPDGPMVAGLSKHFRVVPFSGVPPASRAGNDSAVEHWDADNYSRSLRMAAARGGNDVILCYWGVLESANTKLATKTMSWVPVVNWVVPDEVERMRLRLKLALVDVRTGNWTVLSPEPVDSKSMVFSPRRAATDQKLVERLKEHAYAAAARELLSQYSDVALQQQ